MALSWCGECWNCEPSYYLDADRLDALRTDLADARLRIKELEDNVADAEQRYQDLARLISYPSMTYSKKYGTGYLTLIEKIGPGEVARTSIDGDGVALDYDFEDHLIGIEFLRDVHPDLIALAPKSDDEDKNPRGAWDPNGWNE